MWWEWSGPGPGLVWPEAMSSSLAVIERVDELGESVEESDPGDMVEEAR